jgi:serine/threonine protein kinase
LQQVEAVCSVIARHGPSVREVEDLGKQKWAIKGIDSGPNAAREAERLCKLRGHPLIVPLHSTFMDAGRLYLQMPFYQNGNLRKWVEQIKVTSRSYAILI